MQNKHVKQKLVTHSIHVSATVTSGRIPCAIVFNSYQFAKIPRMYNSIHNRCLEIIFLLVTLLDQNKLFVMFMVSLF